jgi:hypothetical protein
VVVALMGVDVGVGVADEQAARTILTKMSNSQIDFFVRNLMFCSPEFNKSL